MLWADILIGELAQKILIPEREMNLRYPDQRINAYFVFLLNNKTPQSFQGQFIWEPKTDIIWTITNVYKTCYP